MSNPFAANPALVAAEAEVASAEERFRAALEAVQAECAHGLVVQSPASGNRDNYRICAHCRLVERGSHWSYTPTNWSRHDYGKSMLDNTESRIVVQMHSGNWWEWRDSMTHCAVT